MPPIPLRERIRRAVTIGDDGCWRWLLYVDKHGYGRITLRDPCEGTTTYMAHRIAYAAWHGDIPAGLDIDHLCRVRECVNPDHLEPVTRAENLRRSRAAIT